MKLTSNDSLQIKYRKNSDQSTASVTCIQAYIRKSQIPECMFMTKWEDTEYSNPALLSSKPVSLGWRWSIRLENFVITFNNENFASDMFNLFLTDFEGCDISEKFPEYFL